ncbi:energy-coupling factor ABC transporter permease [Paraneptunicella aestuarii]|uniref:energy-coupling factor ABC transporter permease n=1 Tax=Paraneptunicella aestuarii TaxID=2831148 RepID=UPI0038CDBBC1|nr:energy-coupling factor ABC transporter permease [Paraneptunicella aestuarii]
MTFIQTLCLLLYLGLIGLTAKSLNLKQRIAHKTGQHLLFGSAASLFFLWLFRTGIYPGLNVHFLWLTALVLLLGFRLAIISSAITLLGITAINHESWQMFGVNGLLGIAIPMSLSYLIYNITFHRLPKHLFVYIFVSAFFAGAATLTLKMGLLGGYYALEGIHSWDIVEDNYLILIPLLLFPEGLLNGMTMTLLVIYTPHWVYTYHDKYYMDK